MTDTSSPPKRRTRRVSLTKLQRESVAGVELISLCQGITEDGTLSDLEILTLEGWLWDYQSLELPAREYLLALLRQFAEDGAISMAERRELYKAIESVLPPDIRALVRRTRLAGERTNRDLALEARRIAREAALADARARREEARAGRLRAKPLQVFDFMVAGVAYEGRSELVDTFCVEGDPVFLIRDRDNRFSRNAVEVRVGGGLQIGFVPEPLARSVAALLDKGHLHRAYIKKIIDGARAPVPVVVAAIHRTDCGLHDAISEERVPPKVALRVPAEPASRKE